jgi:hypothetical protein
MPDLHTAVAQHLAVAGRQGVAADPVVEHEHLHAFGRLAQQQLLQLSAEGVVVDDEELHQHGVTGLVDGSEDRMKVASPLISSFTSLFARHGMRPSLGMARRAA